MRRIFLILTLFFVTCAPDDRQIDTLFDSYDGEKPGAALMVIRNGRPILTRTYGLADIEAKTAITSRTNFRLASVTKQFTAMCIMMLVERGAMRYDDTLVDIFPEFPAYGKRITVRHLLHHVSGLVDYESLLPENDTTQVLDRDVLDLMMKQDSTYFEPGSHFQYSNSGYAVLAMIVEKISGQNFAQFLKQNIFQPLRMTGSVAYEKGISVVDERAFGYVVDGDSIRFSDQSATSAVLGDGGIYSSLKDLYRWDQALYTEELVSSGTLKQAFTPGVKTEDGSVDYGFGWRIDTYHGHRRIHHTGSTCGFRNVFQRYPDIRLSIIILTNRSEPELMQLANCVADLYVQ